jgi:uncharacterized tellurite resistance protein B-like protein
LLQNKIEDLIEEYKAALSSAVDYHRQISELLTTLDNDYSLDVTTRLTTLTINFKNVIEKGSSDG